MNPEVKKLCLEAWMADRSGEKERAFVLLVDAIQSLNNSAIGLDDINISDKTKCDQDDSELTLDDLRIAANEANPKNFYPLRLGANQAWIVGDFYIRRAK